MIRVLYTKDFLKQAQALPTAQQNKLAKLLELFAANPYDARLHTKHLSSPLVGILSFRVTRDWRVLFRFDSADAVVCITVKHRKVIYR